MVNEYRTKVFLDTNVLIDVFLQDRAYSHSSKIILQAIREHLLEGVITVQSLVDANYVLSKNGMVSQEAFFREVRHLRSFVNVEDLGIFDVEEAISHPTGDFEDDLQFARARYGFCDYIITGARQFQQRYQNHPSGITICTPEEFVALMKQ